MRYLTSISLALIVLMALACTATLVEPTPSGPMYSEEEAIGILKEHLQNKPVPIPGYPPQITCFSFVAGTTWSAEYDNEGHRWGIRLDGELGWSVYERTKSIVAIGNRLC
jgi:hypothetical protein